MNKSILVGAALLALVATSPVRASSLSTAETGTLATIAAIDKNEVLTSVVALNKNPSAETADFAKMMIDQHGENLALLLEMASTNHVKSLSSIEANKLIASGNKLLLTVSPLTGNQFDKAYADAMVAGHTAALQLIDNKLMKTAKSAVMKKFMTDTRNTVADHLEQAKKLQEATR